MSELGNAGKLAATAALSIGALGMFGLARGDAVPCEIAAQTVDRALGLIPRVDILANCDFNPGLGVPENVGAMQTRLSDRIGRLAINVETEFVMDRVLFSADANFRADHIKTARIDHALVDWTTDENGYVLVTRIYNGEDIGISPSSLELELEMPETDIADGVDDDQCRTDPSSPQYSGCVYDMPVTNGLEFPGLGADNQGEISARMQAIEYAKANDNYCLTNYYLPAVMNPVLSGYGLSVAEGDSAAVARYLQLGFVRLQMAQKLNKPVQQILIHLNDQQPYDPGLSYSQEIARLGAGGNLGSLTDADSADNWCVDNMQAPVEDIERLIHAALAADGYDWVSNSFFEGDPNLARPTGYASYQEQGYV